MCVSLQTGYTVKNEACQTSCTNHNDRYTYCWLGWGQSNWDYCDTNNNGADVMQPLGQYEGTKTDLACTSFCNTRSGNKGPLWCLSGSTNSDCAPDPIPELSLKFLAKWVYNLTTIQVLITRSYVPRTALCAATGHRNVFLKSCRFWYIPDLSFHHAP